MLRLRLLPHAAFLAAGLAAGPAAANGNGLHPEVPILDSQGEPVAVSGRPMSTMVTCDGECHDTQYIAASSDHADAGASQLGRLNAPHEWQLGPGYYGGWDPLRYDLDGMTGSGAMEPSAWLARFGDRHVGGGPVTALTEMDCLLCHGVTRTAKTRAEWLRRGHFEWANSAHFTALGALQLDGGDFRWRAERFRPGGALVDGLPGIRKPTDENCGQCHGQVDNSLDEPLVISHEPLERHDSERTGQLFSPQKLLNSGLNIAGKEKLDHPFDVHSDRVVGCVNCHYSLNNPVYFRQREESRPAHLDFDPRRLTSAEYLARPLHQFAKGSSMLGLAAAESEHSLRRCESCHDAAEVHEWLPFKQRHFRSLACESCHVPRLYGPGLQAIDWTMLDEGREPLRQYRARQGDPAAVDTLVEGFAPALLPRTDGDGETKLAPFNLVASWYWIAGNPARPVPRSVLEQALFDGAGYHPDLVSALDSDGDGELLGAELRLDSADRLAAVQRRLEAGGMESVMLANRVIPFPVSHNVVSGRWATRECAACHGAGSRLDAPFPLSGYAPGGVNPGGTTMGGAGQAGALLHGTTAFTDTTIHFRPDTRSAGFYIIGLHGERWADLLGVLLFLGVVAGVTVHAAARYLASHRRTGGQAPRERVYMYDAYERLWHWLQASTILLLLATGLVIHKPHLFGMFSFPYIVRVHNVLGFILLANAALALFYNLASGEIRQYLPQPKGFIGRSISQALYYSRGIFAGQPHPFEKTRDRKLNPLQQVTYLVILNVLLPTQVITGLLIWGLQRWPDIAMSLGGLPVLALVHTLVAWLFAAFIVMHVYLTTAAGHTPTAGIRAMIEGWDEVEKHPKGSIMAAIRGWDFFDKPAGTNRPDSNNGDSP